MSSKYNIDYPDIPFSITNTKVGIDETEDRFTPFTLLQFITKVAKLVDSQEVTSYYNLYLQKWNKIKDIEDINSEKTIIKTYSDFIKDISLDFNSQSENDFLSKIDYANPLDLDIALSFIAAKIKKICLYYKNKREDIKHQATHNKLIGTGKGLVSAIKKKVLNLLDNNSTNYDVEAISKKINVNVEELYSVDVDIFNKKPNSVDYEAKDLDYNIDIFLRDNSRLIRQVFADTSIEFDNLNEVSDIFDQKRLLTKKYIGSDYYYLSASPIIGPEVQNKVITSGFNVKYSKKLTTTPPTLPCLCFSAVGPLTFSFIRCGNRTATNVTLPQNSSYADCAYKGNVNDINGSGSVNLFSACTSSEDCIGNNTTTTTTSNPPPPTTGTTTRPTTRPNTKSTTRTLPPPPPPPSSTTRLGTTGRGGNSTNRPGTTRGGNSTGRPVDRDKPSTTSRTTTKSTTKSSTTSRTTGTSTPPSPTPPPPPPPPPGKPKPPKISCCRLWGGQPTRVLATFSPERDEWKGSCYDEEVDDPVKVGVTAELQNPAFPGSELNAKCTCVNENFGSIRLNVLYIIDNLTQDKIYPDISPTDIDVCQNQKIEIDIDPIVPMQNVCVSDLSGENSRITQADFNVFYTIETGGETCYGDFKVLVDPSFTRGSLDENAEKGHPYKWQCCNPCEGCVSIEVLEDKIEVGKFETISCLPGLEKTELDSDGLLGAITHPVRGYFKFKSTKITQRVIDEIVDEFGSSRLGLQGVKDQFWFATDGVDTLGNKKGIPVMDGNTDPGPFLRKYDDGDYFPFGSQMTFIKKVKKTIDGEPKEVYETSQDSTVDGYNLVSFPGAYVFQYKSGAWQVTLSVDGESFTLTNNAYTDPCCPFPDDIDENKLKDAYPPFFNTENENETGLGMFTEFKNGLPEEWQAGTATGVKYGQGIYRNGDTVAAFVGVQGTTYKTAVKYPGVPKQYYTLDIMSLENAEAPGAIKYARGGKEVDPDYKDPENKDCTPYFKKIITKLKIKNYCHNAYGVLKRFNKVSESYDIKIGIIGGEDSPDDYDPERGFRNGIWFDETKTIETGRLPNVPNQDINITTVKEHLRTPLVDVSTGNNVDVATLFFGSEGRPDQRELAGRGLVPAEHIVYFEHIIMNKDSKVWHQCKNDYGENFGNFDPYPAFKIEWFDKEGTPIDVNNECIYALQYPNMSLNDETMDNTGKLICATPYAKEIDKLTNAKAKERLIDIAFEQQVLGALGDSPDFITNFISTCKDPEGGRAMDDHGFFAGINKDSGFNVEGTDNTFDDYSEN